MWAWDTAFPGAPGWVGVASTPVMCAKVTLTHPRTVGAGQDGALGQVLG